MARCFESHLRIAKTKDVDATLAWPTLPSSTSKFTRSQPTQNFLYTMALKTSTVLKSCTARRLLPRRQHVDSGVSFADAEVADGQSTMRAVRGEGAELPGGLG